MLLKFNNFKLLHLHKAFEDQKPSSRTFRVFTLEKNPPASWDQHVGFELSHNNWGPLGMGRSENQKLED